MNQELYDQLLNGGLVALYREKRKKDILQVNDRVRASEGALAKKKASIGDNPYSFRKGFGIFLSIAGGLFFAAFLFSNTFNLIKDSSWLITMIDEDPGDFITNLILCIASGIAFFTGVGLIVSAKKLRKKYVIKTKEEYKAEEEKYTDLLKKSTEELNGITAEINEFNANHGHFLDFLPEKYRSIEAIGFMLEAVYNLRADTLKEVINLYEAELRDRNIARMQQLQNERMLYAMSQINDNQERINSTLQEIKTLQFVDIMTN